jgi:Xaa-Pro aminopeptidase
MNQLAIDIPARLDAIEQRTLRAARLAKVRAELVKRDYGAALLSDPTNIRYATGSRNMSVWTMHGPGRYVFVPVDGPVVLFEDARRAATGDNRERVVGDPPRDQHRP